MLQPFNTLPTSIQLGIALRYMHHFIDTAPNERKTFTEFETELRVFCFDLWKIAIN